MAAQHSNARRLAILDRRRHVASLLARGYTQREIVAALEAAKIVNQADDKPWSLGTINADAKAVEAIWRQEIANDVDTHRSRLAAQLREVYRRAWQLDDLDKALKAIQQQREMLGTDAPRKAQIEATGKDGAPLHPWLPIDVAQLSDAELDLLEKIFSGANRPQGGAGEDSAGALPA